MTPKVLEPLSVKDFMALSFPAIKQRIEGFVPAEGYGIFGGPYKTGKSLNLLEMGICVAAGLDWMGAVTNQCPVLLIEEEGAKVNLKDRLERQLLKYGLNGKDIPLYLVHRSMMKLQDPGWIAALDDVIARTGAKLVLMSSMAQVGGIAEENDQREHNLIHDAVRGLVDRHGVAILIAVHTGKMTFDKPPRDVDAFFRQVRGNSALMGAVDFAFGLVRPVEDAEGTMFYTGRDFEPRKWPVVFAKPTLTFEPDLAAALMPATPMDKHKQAIVDFLNMKPGEKELRQEIQAATAIAGSTIQRYLDDLVLDKKISKERRGAGLRAPYVYWVEIPF